MAAANPYPPLTEDEKQAYHAWHHFRRGYPASCRFRPDGLDVIFWQNPRNKQIRFEPRLARSVFCAHANQENRSIIRAKSMQNCMSFSPSFAL